ncbi:MAG: beta-lactamase family protein [Gemmatimonadetes bacterium]|nr:beta-lactamase family protein [Gemmatimonadota bacterium]
MMRLHRFLVVVPALALLGLPLGAVSLTTAKPEEVGLSPERLQRVREAVQRHIDDKNIAGAVTIVARRGRIAHFEAQGLMEIEGQKPMVTDAIFRLASTSKPITGVAVMMLIEEGKIRLSDPVSRFIPEFATLNKVAVPRPGGRGAAGGGRGAGGGGRGGGEAAYDLVTASREITIHDLLTHGSGLLSGGLGSSAAPQRSPNDTLATYIPKLASVPLDFQPGTLWRYSGQAGFDVLSRIVEVTSGLPYDRFLKTRIFDPLGMKDTGFVVPAASQPRLATIYRRTPEGLQRGENQNQLMSTTYFSGAGGMVSTAEDYLQFAQMLVNGGELNGRRLLSPRTVELMTANHTGDMVNGQFGRPARGMGFGLSVQTVLDPVAADLRQSPGTFGWAGAFGTNVNVDPKEQMVTVVFIQNQGGSGALHRDFENAAMQAIVD